MARPQGPPELTIINGIMYRLVVFKIVSENEDGTPWELMLMKDNEVAEIVGGKFMTGYVRQYMLEPKSGK